MPHDYQPIRSLDQLAERAAADFKKQFGRPPRVVVAAPGRVNLIGEHTDYNGGFVLPMAIDRYAVIAGDLSIAGEHPAHVRCYSHAFDETATFAATGELHPGEPGWSNFLRGVVAGMVRACGHVPGFDCAVETNIPLGGGLSSSAALEVATATLIEALVGKLLDPLEKARLCQRAEHEFVGMPCGIMDQLASTMGRAGLAMLIDCESEQVRYVPLTDEVSILVTNCNKSHTLSGSPYAERRAACYRAAEKLGASWLRQVTSQQLEAARNRLDELEYRRARHVVTENERTLAAAAAMTRGDWPAMGELMYASHASMRDDFEISCAELDALVEIARGIGPGGGVLGARLTGGGFGGSTVTLVRTEQASQVARNISEEYLHLTGINTRGFVSPPTAGARVVPGSAFAGI